MWITKDSQIALFKVNILQERRWSIQGKNVQLITEAELVNPTLIFAVVYHLPTKLANTTFDETTEPILHICGKLNQLGFETHFDLLQHNLSLEHHNLGSNPDTTYTKIYMPVCGVAQQLQLCFTNITDKPSFHKKNNEIISDDNSPNHTQTTDSNVSSSDNLSNEDFGIIEIYGYSIRQIPAPKTAIPILNLSTFFQYKIQNFCPQNQNDYKLLMTAAECDTMCAYVSIQSRYFNQATELLNRSKNSWLKLYDSVSRNQGTDERNSFLKQIREKREKFKYNALKLDVLIAYVSNEHNDFNAQIEAIVNIINYKNICDESSENLLPLQIIAKHSQNLIKTLLLTAKDESEFVKLASFKSINFILEKLGCNIKQNMCDILSEIFEFTNDSCDNITLGLQSKPLHIQSLIRQLIITKHNICDFALNLISDCNFEIVTNIFETLIIDHFDQILKLESTKLSYCLRIFELCIDRLHTTPTITSSILTSIMCLLFHPSKRVKNISTSICTSFLYILPMQILQTNDSNQQVQICEWLCDMITNADIKQEFFFPKKTSKSNGSDINQNTNNETNESNAPNTLLMRIPMIIINKMCETQLLWNGNQNTHNIGLLNIKQYIDKLCICLKDRILSLLMSTNSLEKYFDVFKSLLQNLYSLSCSIRDFKTFDELVMNVFGEFLSHLKSSAPSLLMLKICIEFMQCFDEGKALKKKHRFTEITLEIMREFHKWIPHSINDETFFFAKKLIDINYMFLTQNDFVTIVQSLLNKYTLRSTIYQEFQYDIIGRIYERIQVANENRNLFKLITKMLIFDAAEFEDMEKMHRYFHFGSDWLQHQQFENIYIHDFYILFMRIITVFSNIMFKCKNRQIVNISMDIVTSLSIHFSSAISKYTNTPTAITNNIPKIAQILNKMSTFYTNSLEIGIGNIQFHSVQNITLFLNSMTDIVSGLHKLEDFKENSAEMYNNCIVKLLEQLLELSLHSHFRNITDLCLSSVCNFYYAMARANDTQQKLEIITNNDTELIIKYATQMMKNRDYKIRRWAGLLIYLRFYFFTKFTDDTSQMTDPSEYMSILDQLSLDCDEFVSQPLSQLIILTDIGHIIQFIESTNLLHRPNCVLTVNIENEASIGWRSDTDTASVNQARHSKNTHSSAHSAFNTGLNMDSDDLRIVDVDEMDDIDIISESSDDDTSEDKENNKLLSNTNDNDSVYTSDESASSSISNENDNDNEAVYIEDEEYSNSSDGSLSASSSSDDNLEVQNGESKNTYLLKNKIAIPLLPLDSINNGCEIQTNIIQTRNRESDEKEVTEMEETEEEMLICHEIEEDDDGVCEADDEREESMDSCQNGNELKQEFEDSNELWMNESDGNVTFERGTKMKDESENSTDLTYIQSFLQSISIKNNNTHSDDNKCNMNGLETKEITIEIKNEPLQSEKESVIVNEERLCEFRKSELNDYLVNVPRVTNRKSGWWMKYLNSNVNNTDKS